MKAVARFLTLLPILVFVGLAHAGTRDNPKVSDQPLNAEQLAVYRGALLAWFGAGELTINLSSVTDPIDEDGFGFDKACARLTSVEPSVPAVLHHFRQEDLNQLGSRTIRLIDPEKGRDDVRQNDPGTAIRNGKTVDEAVKKGFSHGLLTFSEIRFNKEHTSAVVSFQFFCGSLCGNGSTLVLTRTKSGEWKRIRNCGGFIS